MWEITLIAKHIDILYIQELIDNLNSHDYSVVSAINLDKDLICSIAIDNDKNIDLIEDLLFETILKITKSEYYIENLNIFGNDKSFNSFMLSTLILMDLKDEIEYSKIQASLTKKVCIRSFVNFKLKKTINIWKRIVNYINAQFSCNMQDAMYLDFLKFIATNFSSQIDIVYLEQNDDKIYLLDKERKVMSEISKNDEIGMIVSIIIYSPKKLIINCTHNLSSKVTNLLGYIFEDRLSLLL